MRLSILDDYQGVALDMADWSPIRARGVEIAVERHPFVDEDSTVRALADSEIVAAMRERTAFPKSLVGRLPKLKLLITTGMRNASFDMTALKDRGVTVCGTGGPGGGNEDTAELAWGLILSAARRISEDHQLMRLGGWQTRIGHRVAGKTLGLLGLGRLGSAVARVGLAFRMKAIAWSQNLTAERAAEHGVERVEKDELFRRSDILSAHLVLSARSRGLVGAREIGLMKPSAILVNTSRGPICDTEAIIAALKAKRLAYGGFDVYDKEPLPIDHPLRTADRRERARLPRRQPGPGHFSLKPYEGQRFRHPGLARRRPCHDYRDIRLSRPAWNCVVRRDPARTRRTGRTAPRNPRAGTAVFSCRNGWTRPWLLLRFALPHAFGVPVHP